MQKEYKRIREQRINRRKGPVEKKRRRESGGVKEVRKVG
jgi:hypothetical protein